MKTTEEFEAVLDHGTVAGPASEGMILEAEQRLSVKFPSPYRAFLKKYGAALGTGFEISGLFVADDNGPPLWRDIVAECTRFRESVRGMLPESLIPISDDGCGVSYYIDATVSKESTCPVIAYGPGVDGRVVADSFEEFIVQMARDQIVGEE